MINEGSHPILSQMLCTGFLTTLEDWHSRMIYVFIVVFRSEVYDQWGQKKTSQTGQYYCTGVCCIAQLACWLQVTVEWLKRRLGGSTGRTYSPQCTVASQRYDQKYTHNYVVHCLCRVECCLVITWLRRRLSFTLVELRAITQ